MNPQIIAGIGQKADGLINRLPLKLAVKIYSSGRRYFMNKFLHHEIQESSNINFADRLKRKLWNLDFKIPLMNSAGMFKNGEGYSLVANQGAGAYLGGTSTFNPREGNIKYGIKHPFITFPKNHISLNYLGLPNLGDEILSQQCFKNKSCPIGWSVMRSPDYAIDEAMEKLIDSLWLYHDNLSIDFLEINESCPNVGTLSLDLTSRLYFIASQFLSKRKRHIPVVLKLSNDISIDMLPKLLDVIFECKFDGVNLGNTSTNYNYCKDFLSSKREIQLFDYFTKSFGGGVGGVALKTKSFSLCEASVKYREQVKPGYEFHIIRTGGINSFTDIVNSDGIGVSINQWYTGYFENYIKYGNNLYAQVFKAYKRYRAYIL